MKKLLKQFNDLRLRYNLQFSHKSLLRDCAIGLDELQCKMLIVCRSNGEEFKAEYFAVADLASCKVVKQYGRINAGDLLKGPLDLHLEQIILTIEFANDRQVLHIPFYNSTIHNMEQVAELGQRARYWESILSKCLERLLPTPA